MVKGQKVLANLGEDKGWVEATYEKPLNHRGREGQHLVIINDGVHAAIALEVKDMELPE